VNGRNCCQGISAGSSPTSATRIATRGPRPPARRVLAAARWLIPGGILAVLPKCPACLVAYFALAGGIGISLSTATYLRMALLILCPASLCCFAARGVASVRSAQNLVKRQNPPRFG